MKHCLFAAALACCLYASASLAHTAADANKPLAVTEIDEDAKAAVAVVDAFGAAIQAARLDAAADLLDPQVLILESGGSERSREEYLAGHAIADANFLQNARILPRYRQAHAAGGFAWVGSEGLIETEDDGKPLRLLSTETMLLRKGEQGWKIVHIHWSSRPAK